MIISSVMSTHFFLSPVTVACRLSHVYHILYEDLSPKAAIKKLMSRELKDELEAMQETW